MDATTPAVDDSSRRLPAPLLLRLRFTGSGSEYFRIWIVNLALTLVTLGFYYPWAKVRRLRYFYNHTLLADHGFDFHGAPRSMLRGMVLVGVLFFLYSFAADFAPLAGLVAAIAVTALWPFLWRTALRFRLANTSWRGLRFAFVGNVKGALIAAGIPTALLLIPLAIASFWFLQDADPESPQGQAALIRHGIITLAIFVPWLAVLPWFYWYAKRYRHNNFRYAQLATELTTRVGAVYRLSLKVLGISIVGIMIFGAIAAGTAFYLEHATNFPPKIDGAIRDARVFLIIGNVTLGYLFIFILVRAYTVARTQNLFWSNTRAPELAIQSNLSFRVMLRLMIRNWILIVLTLGFYWPFAAIAVWRARLDALSLELAMPLESLISRLPVALTDTVGEMAADLADFDFGW